MDEEFIRNRITELRLKKGASEYQMSLALGQNGQFFDAEAVNPQLIRKAMDGMRKLKDEDLIMLIGFINRLQSKD